VKVDCERAEIIAGAIALGEATERECDLYRRHLASCSACCSELVGERELERTAAAVARARDAERWEPEVSFHRIRQARSRRAVRVALSGGALAASAAIAAGIAVMLRAQDAPPQSAGLPAVAKVSTTHGAQTPPQTPRRHIVIVHNVVTLTAPASSPRPHVQSAPAATPVLPASSRSAAAAGPRKKPQQPQRVAAAPEPLVPQSNVPIWRRYEPLPRANSTPAPLSMRAESIEVAPMTVIREVTPIGGEGAINPQPPLIAYAERAEGTTAFDVSVDEHGMPTKCTITKSSGFLSLDGAVCRAAMKARYYPRTVNGHPVPGVYRDAFTFRQADEEPLF
jgi:TonB family protein